MQLRGTGSQTCRQNFEKSGPAIWIYCGVALINERKNQPPAVQMHKAGGWFYKS